MRKLILFIVYTVIFAAAVFSQTGYGGEKGVSSIGISTGYAIENKAFVIGADFRYNILARLRISSSALYAWDKVWYVNGDTHYLLRVTNETTVYPLVGIGVSAWKNAMSRLPEENLEYAMEYLPRDTTLVRAGLNLGVGVERRMTRDIILGLEFKYNLTPERIYNQAMLLGRIAYYF